VNPARWPLASALGSMRKVKVADCVHHCGFRYGRGEAHPYESFAAGMAAGVPLSFLRARFLDFVRHYRPRDLGEALGTVLDVPLPLWQLPWARFFRSRGRTGWVARAADVPDIITHYSAAGVPWDLIEKEYFWLERAFEVISTQGYRPREHGPIRALELVDADRSAFIIRDGNHRLSALSALGAEQALVWCWRWHRVHWSDSGDWPLVRRGACTAADARRVFRAYFDGNQRVFRSQSPAAIVGAPSDPRSETSLA
jgi:hypothetical protein